MRNIRVAAVTINQTPLDWEGNQQRIVAAIKEAEQKQVQVLCFPELCLSGYGCEDAFYSPFVVETSIKLLFSLLPYTKGKVVTLGLPLLFKGTLFNVVAVLADQKVIGIIPKKALANDGVYYEGRWFKPWTREVREIIELLNPLDGKMYSIPIGDYFFDIGGIKFGLEICEEAWIAQRTGVTLAQKGVEVLLNPSASHFSFQKHEIRKRFVIEGSRALGVAYIFSNLLGNESGRIIFDGSGLVASNGELVLESKRFSFRDYEVFDCLIDVDSNRIRRVQAGNFKPDLGEKELGQISTVFEWKVIKPLKKIKSSQEKAQWELSPEIKNEEFYRAVTLGLFDYLRKSKSWGFVISLSGGVDSSVVTLLATYSLIEAERALGSSEFVKKLNYIANFADLIKQNEWLKEFIHVAYQATENSSQETLQAAKLLAQELKISFYEWKISDLNQGYIDILEKATQCKLSWEKDDISLQNIQARTRSPGVWLLANIKKALLLSTSNRSEAAVGYATMDGDTSGGLSPIAGVDKAFLNQWIRWASQQGPDGVGAIQSLRAVYQKPPSAELRPLQAQQEDEKDLMPYEILDKIEREFIKERKSPRDIVECVIAEFPNYAAKDICGFVIKFLRLWSRNQWKRERYAPAFHLDDESLDPKTWCRYPILMSSFELEIKGLESQFQN